MPLVKLQLQSFNTPACTGSAIGSIYVLVNPENYSEGYTVDYASKGAIKDAAETLVFSSMKSSELQLKKLMVDGTGIIPLTGATSVQDYLDKLAKVAYLYNGTMHSPPYVKITWGSLIFKGVCTAFTTNYTLFQPDGTVLRATVDMTFKSTVDPKTKGQQAANSSPDLTHMRTVKAGDTLPLMSYQVYGDSSYYLEIARFNGLNDVYNIKPGEQLYFPPLKK
jgi:LysM repeat protein